MKLTTSRNKEYEADFAGGETFTSGEVVVQMKDERRLSEIAAEFDGLEWMKAENHNDGDITFEGYQVLRSIMRRKNGSVILTFGKE